MNQVDSYFIDKSHLSHEISIIMSTYLTLNEQNKFLAKEKIKQIQKEIDELEFKSND